MKGKNVNKYQIGDTVQARDFSEMLYLCGTFHSKVTHGEVVDLRPEYSASVSVLWFTEDEPQTVAYYLSPEVLISA